MSAAIRISNDIQTLTGEGLEYLTDPTERNVIFKFFNGNIMRVAGQSYVAGDTPVSSDSECEMDGRKID